MEGATAAERAFGILDTPVPGVLARQSEQPAPQEPATRPAARPAPAADLRGDSITFRGVNRLALAADLLAATTGRATLLITHDLDGLDQVNEIVVLDHGRVAERGGHRQLIAAGGLYQQMWAAHQGGSPVTGAGTRLGG